MNFGDLMVIKLHGAIDASIDAFAKTATAKGFHLPLT